MFVHRDFHVSNLMTINNQIAVIDSQDAVIGNRAYDLASLIDDVRLKTSRSLKNKIYELYISKQKKLNKIKFIKYILENKQNLININSKMILKF